MLDFRQIITYEQILLNIQSLYLLKIYELSATRDTKRVSRCRRKTSPFSHSIDDAHIAVNSSILSSCQSATSVAALVILLAIRFSLVDASKLTAEATNALSYSMPRHPFLD